MGSRVAARKPNPAIIVLGALMPPSIIFITEKDNAQFHVFSGFIPLVTAKDYRRVFGELSHNVTPIAVRSVSPTAAFPIAPRGNATAQTSTVHRIALTNRWRGAEGMIFINGFEKPRSHSNRLKELHHFPMVKWSSKALMGSVLLAMKSLAASACRGSPNGPLQS
jgi:hypothetical protein